MTDLRNVVEELQQLQADAQALVASVNSLGESFNQLNRAFMGHIHQWGGSNTSAASVLEGVGTFCEPITADFTFTPSTNISVDELLKLFRKFETTYADMFPKLRMFGNAQIVLIRNFNAHTHQFALSNTSSSRVYLPNVTVLLYGIYYNILPEATTLEEMQKRIQDFRFYRLNDVRQPTFATSHWVDMAKDVFNGHTHWWFLGDTTAPTNRAQ